MKRCIGILFSVSILALWTTVFTSSIFATLTPTRQWGDSGKIIASALGAIEQGYPVACSDGAGGTIVAWLDKRGGSTGLYAQRVDSNGNKLWTTDGVTICASTVVDPTSAGVPDIVADGSGGAIITWVDNRNGNADIYAQKVNSSGAVQWLTNGVTICANAAKQSNPKLCCDQAGGAIIVWEDARNGGVFEMKDIYATRVSSTGTVGGNLWVEDGKPICNLPLSEQRTPQIAYVGIQGADIYVFVITWEDWRNVTSDIYAMGVTRTGGTPSGGWSSNGVPISVLATGYRTAPRIISDGNGSGIISWSDSRDGLAYRPFAQKVDTGGTTWWITNGVTVCAGADVQSNLEMTSDGAGGAIITWSDGRNYGVSGYDIYARRILNDGTPTWDANGVVICNAADDQSNPQITTDGAGGAIITWYDRRDGTNYDVYTQKVTSSGSVSWTTNGVAINTSTNNATPPDPRIVSSVSNGAIIVWRDSRSGSGGGDIYGQRINGSGSVQWTNNGKEICSAKGPAAQDQPVLCAGSGVVVWRDARDGGDDIYAQKFDENGNPLWTPSDGVPICTNAMIGTSAKRNLGSVCKTGDKYLIVWEDQRNGNSDIYAQLLNSSGSPQWTSGGIPITLTTSNETSPSCAPNGAGGGVIVWENTTGGGGGGKIGGWEGGGGIPISAAKKIYAKRINSSGGFVWGGGADSPGLLVNTYDSDTNLNQEKPHIANIGGGSVVVVWQDDRNSSESNIFDIYGQKLAISDGARQWADVGVAICDATNSQITPRIASLGDGSSVITWADARAGRTDFIGNPCYDIYAQKLNSGGIAQWTANGVPVSSESNNNTLILPQVTIDPAGTNLIAFLKYSTDFDLLLQALDASGNTLLPSPYQVVTYSGYKDYPNIAAIGAGDVILSWDPSMIIGVDTDIHIQRITGLAEAVTTTTTTTTTTLPGVTTTTSTTTTLPVSAPPPTLAPPRIVDIPNKVHQLRETSQGKTLLIGGSNFRPGAEVTLSKNGRTIFGKNIIVSSDGRSISFDVDLPPRTDTYAIGYWDVTVRNPDGTYTTYPRGYLMELPEGEVYVYPSHLRTSTLRAATPAAQARIAYTLSADKTIDIFIYDVREMKVIYHRRFTAGQPGGAFGYNEIIWDGKIDSGSIIANGSYVLQVVSGGKVLAQTYFVVTD